MIGAIDAGAPIVCVMDDGGIGFRVPVDSNIERRRALAAATLTYRTFESMPLERQTRELQAMDREARRGDWSTAGLILRAPDRTRGRPARIDGLVISARESAGSTSLRIEPNGLMGASFDVILPGIAYDQVVTGARVRVYGVHADERTETAADAATTTIPLVYAMVVVPITSP